MKTARRLILALLFCITLVVGVHASAYAETIASGTCGDNVNWSLDDEGTLTISGTGAMADYAKPSDAPYADEDIYAVVVEEGVTHIGKNAFAGMFLDKVTLPESLTSIGVNAFYGAAITEAHFTGNLKQWEKRIIINGGNLTLTNIITMDKDVTFDDDELGLHLANGVLRCTANSLGSITDPFKDEYRDYVFEVVFEEGIYGVADSGCRGMTAVRTVTIRDGATYIGESAFKDCTNMTNITIPDSVTGIGSEAFYGCSGLANVEIPESVTSIGGFAFTYSNLMSVTIPDSVTYISDWAFYSCSGLKSVIIGTGVTNIGDYVFYCCSELTSVAIPNSVTSIGVSAFHCCSKLTSVTIPDSVTSIGVYAFAECYGLKSVTIGTGVTSITSGAFSNCGGLTSVTIPDSVTSIGSNAFYYCTSLTSITLPNSVTSIGNVAFEGCSSLTSLTLSNSITSIGEFVFSGCSSLTSVTIPDNVTSIGGEAFSCCSSLTSVTIGSNVTSISSVSFFGCSNLTDVYYNGTVAMWNAIDKGLDNEELSSANIHCLCIDIGATGDCRWLMFYTGLLKIVGQGSMADYAEGSAPWCDYRDQITALEVNNGVANLGSYAFTGLTALESVTGMEGVISIGAGAFKNCSSIAGLSIPASVTTVGQNAFTGCTLLSSAGPVDSGAAIEFGWAKAIPAYAFSGADCLETLTIPEGVTRVMGGAAENCTALTTVNLPSTLTTIQQNTFAGCASLPAIALPDDLKTLGVAAFQDTGLTDVTIPLSVMSIGSNAFDGSALVDVYYPGSRNQWGAINIGTDNETLTGAALHLGRFDINIVSTNGSVAVTVNGEAGVTALEGDAVKLTFTPNAGYQFDTMSVKQGEVDVVVTDNGFTMPTGDVTVTAIFIVAPVFGTPTFTLPAAIKSIGESAFEGMSAMTIVEIPNGCESIGAKVFKGCTSLTKIRIPASVTAIDGTAFDGCGTVYVYGTAPSAAKTFCDSHANCTFVTES